MLKVLTNKTLINKFLTRGVDSIYPSKHALEKKLLSGDRIKAYQGFDPTGPYLHVGHAMGIRALRMLQQLGHEVIFLVGDYTARVGDPDKDKTRELLSPETIEKNEQGWKEQAAQLIDFEGDNPVQFRHNFEWLSKLTLNNLIELMSKTTVQQMIERDMFDRRLKENNPIGLQEFIYPLMQGYDSIAMDVDLEIGGTDQIFNMLMGRTLLKSYKNKEKYVRANTLMEAPDALTMSKTKGNGINLSDTAEDMYGKAMSYKDELIINGLTLLTDVELSDIEEIQHDLNNNQNQMKHKKRMAYEIVKVIKGDKAAKLAQDHFERTIQDRDIHVEDTVKIAESIALQTTTIFDFLKKANPINKSSAEIKRIIQQGGVEVNNQKISDTNTKIKLKSGDIVKFGKRTYISIE